MSFTLVVHGTANPHHTETVKQALLTLAEEARREPHTISYDFYQATDDPAHFVLIAVWESEADWRAHNSGEVHVRYEQSLPPDAWAIRPKATPLRKL